MVANTETIAITPAGFLLTQEKFDAIMRKYLAKDMCTVLVEEVRQIERELQERLERINRGG